MSVADAPDRVIAGVEPDDMVTDKPVGMVRCWLAIMVCAVVVVLIRSLINLLSMMMTLSSRSIKPVMVAPSSMVRVMAFLR